MLPQLAQGESSWLVPPRFERPLLSTDEGGLWSMLDREENKLKRSKFLVRDRELNDYVAGIACRLAGDHCPDMRVYVVRTPVFNANMAPNGMMQVWTGLLLRLTNEAQLAAVLGHEIGHYLARHSLDRLRDAKSRSAFGQFLGIALSAAGAGGAGSLAQLALIAGSFSYGREHEREADRIGMDLMAKAGYEPMEASKVWEQLLTELKAERDWTGMPDQRSVLFATHPLPEERSSELATRAAKMVDSAHETGVVAWRAVIKPHQWAWLEEELKRRRFGETLALLQRLIENTPDDGDLFFFRGETHRIRAADGDFELALDAYRSAETKRNAPADLYRGRGMVLQGKGEEAAAQDAFRRYLTLRPQAADAAMVASYVTNPEKSKP